MFSFFLMRNLILIIVLFFSISVFSAKYETPCLESSDLIFSFGPPHYNVISDFYWFTKYFTAICKVEIGYQDSCYINKTVEQMDNELVTKQVKRLTLFKKLISTPEKSCK